VNDVESALQKSGVRSWRKLASDRAAGKLILKEAQGPARIVDPVEKEKTIY